MRFIRQHENKICKIFNFYSGMKCKKKWSEIKWTTKRIDTKPILCLFSFESVKCNNIKLRRYDEDSLISRYFQRLEFRLQQQQQKRAISAMGTYRISFSSDFRKRKVKVSVDIEDIFPLPPNWMTNKRHSAQRTFHNPWLCDCFRKCTRFFAKIHQL